MIKLQYYCHLVLTKMNIKILALVIILFISYLFNNIIFCASDIPIITKMYSNIENYFLNLTWEKAIRDPVDLAKSIGFIGVSAVSAAYAVEGLWNIRLLGSKFLYNYTPIGHIDDTSGKLYSWFITKNTSGVLKQVIDTVPYEEILPLYYARKYIFPKIFIKPEKSFLNEPETSIKTGVNEHDLGGVLSLPNSRKNSSVVEPTNTIIETRVVEKSVYVPDIQYQDRPFLTKIEANLVAQYQALQDISAIQQKLHSHDFFSEEITRLKIFEKDYFSKHEDFLRLNVKDYFPKNYETVSRLKLTHILFNPDVSGLESPDVTIFFGNSDYKLVLSAENFKEHFPNIYGSLHSALLTNRIILCSYIGLPNSTYMEYGKVKLNIVYTEAVSFFSKAQIDPQNCFLIKQSLTESEVAADQEPLYLLDFMFEQQRTVLEEKYKFLEDHYFDLQTQIDNQYAILDSTKKTSSTQTEQTNISGIMRNIGSYLTTEEDLLFCDITAEGQKLQLYSLLEEQQGLLRGLSAKTKKITESSTSGLIVEASQIEMTKTAITSLLNNPAMFFTMAISTVVIHDWGTVKLAAEYLLGFTHIPFFNDSLQMLISLNVQDIKDSYGFGDVLALKLRNVLDEVTQLQNVSEISSTTNEVSNSALPQPATTDWNKVGMYVCIAGAAAISLYLIKNGMYTTTSTNVIDSGVDVNSFINQVNKELKQL